MSDRRRSKSNIKQDFAVDKREISQKNLRKKFDLVIRRTVGVFTNTLIQKEKIPLTDAFINAIPMGISAFSDRSKLSTKTDSLNITTNFFAKYSNEAKVRSEKTKTVSRAILVVVQTCSASSVDRESESASSAQKAPAVTGVSRDRC